MSRGWLVVVIALTASWSLQYLLTYRQLRHYCERRAVLLGLGRVATGLVKNRWGRGAVVLLAADPGGKVVAAEAMVGATVFCRFRPFPEVLGCEITRLAAGHVPVPNRVLVAAVQRAAACLVGSEKGGDSSSIADQSTEQQEQTRLCGT